ncbi:MAG: sugar transferase [Thermodesulfobacteriota bacterium]
MTEGSPLQTAPACPKKGLFFRTGYQRIGEPPPSVLLLNSGLAFFFLVAGLPLFLLLAAILKLKDGGPVFYRGVRLGLNKRPFVMYKFRTLPVNAQQIIGAELLSEKHRMVTPLTRFLRDTRLDEIPQLVNILRGDMEFIGPRPERPEIYEQRCQTIKNYDSRFLVKPGLIGYSQLFTPHSTPKIIRAHIDNRLMLKKMNPRWMLYLIGYTILIMHRDIFLKGRVFLQETFNTRIARRYSEQRTLRRLRPRRVTVLFRDDAARPYREGLRFVDINDLYFRVEATAELLHTGQELGFKLIRPIARSGRVRDKVVRCRGTVVAGRKLHHSSTPYAYVIKFSPESQLNQYLMDKYFSEKSMA